MDDQFKKAQKPWAKLLEKVDKCKVRLDYSYPTFYIFQFSSLLQTNYHMACKNEKTAVNQERNATKDSSLSQDQVCKCNCTSVGALTGSN